MKMKCSGKREIIGEVKKEWMESVEEWKSVKMKEVRVMMRKEKISENEMHMSLPSSFRINGRTIRCSPGGQTWFLDRQLKDVCLFLFLFLF